MLFAYLLAGICCCLRALVMLPCVGRVKVHKEVGVNREAVAQDYCENTNATCISIFGQFLPVQPSYL